jgi:hypothetical protein
LRAEKKGRFHGLKKNYTSSVIYWMPGQWRLTLVNSPAILRTGNLTLDGTPDKITYPRKQNEGKDKWNQQKHDFEIKRLNSSSQTFSHTH